MLTTRYDFTIIENDGRQKWPPTFGQERSGLDIMKNKIIEIIISVIR
tara:strand:+ start:348 stop:488 length:141 start_codon:yes stop_codon:yes gene_type:complete